MSERTDTIAAISTAMAPSGIGIVRISGPQAVEAADRVFRSATGSSLAQAESHTVQYGHIEERGEILDEVLVSVLRAPRSYTREDTVEINCHGGSLVLRRVLEAVLRAGARLAEPGEFTKRAFLNGRIDLTQAEAVMDLISSENRAAARSALSHLGGALRSRIEGIREKILHETAYIEAALDDPEHYSLDGYAPALIGVLEDALGEIDELLDTADEGRVLKDGVATVILGRPNVGKSTLLNLLAGEERAIVTSVEGTTRDVLEEHVVLHGVPLRLMDTAGLRESSDEVERIGVARARAAAEDADLVLYILDGSGRLTDADRDNIRAAGGKTVILIVNKSDLDQNICSDDELKAAFGAPVIHMSAVAGTGRKELGELIRELFLHGKIADSAEVYITNTRQKEALSRAAASLRLTGEAIDAGLPEDLYTVDLMDAYAALGEIIGADVDEDLIDRIFSEFCMGK